MGSSIPTARANLFTLLQGGAADPGDNLYQVQVTYGPPEMHVEQRVVVAILGVVNITSQDVVIGGQRQEERYSIRMRIKVWDPGSGGSSAELQVLDQRAWGLYGSVRALVQGDRTLTGALTSGFATVATAGQDDSEESPVPALDLAGQAAGWVAFVPLQVVCNARVT